MKTLIIVDVQNDFVPGGSLEVPAGDQIVSVVNRIQGGFDLVLATQDWHPQNHVSFASNYVGKKPFDKISLGDLEQTLWPDHCVQNTEGAEFHPKLNTARVEAIFRKGMDPKIDSYSGFFDNGHKKSTGLAGYLREKKMKNLFFCGLAADICVYFTIKDALNEGFSVTVIEEAVRSLNQRDYKTQKQDLIQRGVQYISSEKV